MRAGDEKKIYSKFQELMGKIKNVINIENNETVKGSKENFRIKFTFKALTNTSIMGTLIKAFFVPIVLIIVLGFVSYKAASNIIMEKVEDSSVSTISAMSMYCDLLTSNVSSKALEIVAGNDMSAYYEVYYKQNDSKAMEYWRNAKKNLLQVKSSVQYLYSYSIIPEDGTYLTSISGSMGDDVYKGFMESPEGKYFQEFATRKNGWFGYHSFLDERLFIPEDRYGLAFFQKFLKANTYLVLDITTEAIEEMLNEMDFGENSIKALIAPDGREIVRIQQSEEKAVDPEDKRAVFTDKSFYAQSKETEETGSSYVTYNGGTYLYVHAPVGKTGIMLCGLIPQDNIVREVSFIRTLCVMLVLLACIIAFVIGSRIATGMSKSVKVMTNGLNEVAKGDLTQKFAIKRKDEFSLLAQGLSDMCESMRTLMRDMQNFGNKVKEMADGAATKSEIIHTSIKEISTAVDEMAEGVQTQAKEADNGNDKMTDFAVKIDEVYERAGDMTNIADRTTDVVEQGRIIVDELNRKSETTVAITKVLVENIDNVQKRSAQIEGFIDTINSIARQTNLLSLNASIEAARAGESGRGFAVVAEEIRKLADESMEAGKSIRDIVGNIGETTTRTTQSAKEAEMIIFAQAASLEETIQVFGEIHGCVESLVNGLKNIADSIREINMEKEQVQESIRSISVVSEQSAVATEEVTATLDDQVSTVFNLARDVELLKTEADALDRSIGRFII
ncbi:methyl-accepting chemotaxis protein [Kineothrix sp. MB12-C1]|uniref:methyl-accepting chemotaxis protein n=1 Tax=Kineothrix sp. MB12-C1 TaxID=3070215 RepID=UPI0027D2BFD8|nr:methyl-accepting chemotaxis protein [Kineothrix sp. MB12-C1]WMC91547.1 methyl-accepting chemotaxis protein [Kineothrix sp. MB12-C1]